MPKKKAKLEPTKLMGNAKVSTAKAKQPGPDFAQDDVSTQTTQPGPLIPSPAVELKSKPIRPVFDSRTQKLFEAPDGEFMLGELDFDRVYYRKMGIWINPAR